jgi:hypothetical protein
MRTVTVRMDAADLSRQMAAMREWLDRHRYEPARFACDQDGNAVVVSVEFPNEREGEAFASHFDGQERLPPAAVEKLRRQRDPSELRSEGDYASNLVGRP